MYYIIGKYYIIGQFLLHYREVLHYWEFITLLVVTHIPVLIDSHRFVFFELGRVEL